MTLYSSNNNNCSPSRPPRSSWTIFHGQYLRTHLNAISDTNIRLSHAQAFSPPTLTFSIGQSACCAVDVNNSENMLSPSQETTPSSFCCFEVCALTARTDREILALFFLAGRMFELDTKRPSPPLSPPTRTVHGYTFAAESARVCCLWSRGVCHHPPLCGRTATLLQRLLAKNNAPAP